MVLFIVLLALIVAGILVYDIPKKQSKEKKKRKFEVPPSFWDDYNYCINSISKMKERDATKVETAIDDMMYKYVELIDYSVYIEKISNLVDAYNKKIKTFAITNNLN